MKQATTDAILQHKIIVIVRGIRRKQLLPLAEALYNGGIRLMEITFDASGKTSDEEIAEDIRLLNEQLGEKMIFGAGTVLKESQVCLTKEAGGRFIISPDTNENVIRATSRAGLVSIPGALTPTEVQTAFLTGADFVKLFPVTALGPEYVKAIKAPLSHVCLLAVGGVNENNMMSYLKAGVCGVGVGGCLVDKTLLAAGDYAAITEKARRYTALLENGYDPLH